MVGVKLHWAQDTYAYAERAQALNYAFEDAPPDYGYDYEDSEAWGWETEDGYYRDVEPVGDDGDRYYYYGPDDDEPFYVRDEGYGYGFDNGILVVIYDPYGRVMPIDFVRSRAGWAGRYLYRARHLRERRSARRWRVEHDRWYARQARYEAEQRAIEQAAREQAEWRAYRERMENRERDHFEAERRRRQEEARRAQADFDRQQAREERQRERDRVRNTTDTPPPVVVDRPGRPERPDRPDRPGRSDRKKGHGGQHQNDAGQVFAAGLM